MEENVNSHLEELTKKVMTTPDLESPSFDFKSSVMTEINTIEQSSVTTYEPLISIRAWVFIGLALIALVFYFVFGDITVTTGWLSKIGIERFYSFEISSPITNLNVSSTLVYAIVFFGIMLAIQIPLLKRYFDQRISVSS
ncbi:hypothetical protein [Psychroserpens sp.]|uniref:hypothetical protein n=1 Tax=Psychroserpens sp. TaxID=2020870 RepID=UPI001B232CA0|nr:hypothetical protein [Psychroserpens sp.]MBO6606864.1 hypothetical protein [Psychroserpens sp.]MBO6632226.1 hypothetical protein [Psychroserpens sp.]MBO6654010.1 hypothetical protein [Psychroserpens sp.]MBO6682704.1 hypothetical protein [Psychroserpens sp.]MBO6750636.1 hypothetical protein [Psychroserpens sp.]